LKKKLLKTLPTGLHKIKKYSKIITLIKDINRNSFVGLGKPEALKHQLKGYWSRRINDEHRLVYKVTEASIVIASCKYHY
jgi:toxin YoeB